MMKLDEILPKITNINLTVKKSSTCLHRVDIARLLLEFLSHHEQKALDTTYLTFCRI